MAKYHILGKFTDQGIKNVKETVKRSERFEEMAKGKGVEITEIMWLLGEHDVFCIAEAENDQTVTALLLQAGSLGFLTTSTSRAFTRDEMEDIVKQMN
ncbi:uncharacterized protein METZ01_LOCUS410259 [marine metagenome]|uniref:GYD domain-containing protein n=1 Tax=marine metagenome TaxID=408172 RepID=A0A382WGF1_9ZZZZ